MTEIVRIKTHLWTITQVCRGNNNIDVVYCQRLSADGTKMLYSCWYRKNNHFYCGVIDEKAWQWFGCRVRAIHRV